jgi:hypothetical protein
MCRSAEATEGSPLFRLHGVGVGVDVCDGPSMCSPALQYIYVYMPAPAFVLCAVTAAVAVCEQQQTRKTNYYQLTAANSNWTADNS